MVVIQNLENTSKVLNNLVSKRSIYISFVYSMVDYMVISLVFHGSYFYSVIYVLLVKNREKTKRIL